MKVFPGGGGWWRIGMFFCGEEKNGEISRKMGTSLLKNPSITEPPTPPHHEKNN
jgi:hypothetical protein